MNKKHNIEIVIDVEYLLDGELGELFDDNEELFKLFKDALQEKINSVFEEMIVLEDVDGNEKRAVLFNSWETDMHYLSDPYWYDETK